MKERKEEGLQYPRKKKCSTTWHRTQKSEHLRIQLLNAILIKGTFPFKYVPFFCMQKRPYSNEGGDLSHTLGYNRELSITSTWFSMQMAEEKLVCWCRLWVILLTHHRLLHALEIFCLSARSNDQHLALPIPGRLGKWDHQYSDIVRFSQFQTINLLLNWKIYCTFL